MIAFVLELINDKLFIGHTFNTNFNINEFKSEKIYWTRKYIPLNEIEIVKNISFDDYIQLTNNYIEIYGVKNVYSAIDLLNIDFCEDGIIYQDSSIEYENDNDTKNEIVKIIKEKTKISCILCGNDEHIVSECTFDFQTDDTNNNVINDYEYSSINLDHTNKKDDIDTIYDIDMDMDMEIDDMNDINNLELLSEQRDYYYHLSYYWYNQVCDLIQYYENYYYTLYNNQYNYIQI